MVREGPPHLEVSTGAEVAEFSGSDSADSRENAPGEGRLSKPFDAIVPGESPRLSKVPVDTIVPGESPRLAGVDPDHVNLLTKLDALLPPILVERRTMRVIDGMHRLQAAIANGHRTIDVKFFDGSEQAAFVEAVRANIAHGLPLSLADRRAAAERIISLFPEWSDRAVAAAAGVSDKTVAAIRRRATAGSPQSNVRLGRDGRVRPLNSAAGRRIASELIEEHPQASLREIARDAGISVATARDVRERLRRGDAPVPTVRRIGAERYVDGQGEGAARGDAGRVGRAHGRPSMTAPSRSRAELADGLDVGPLLEGLKRDPSLRYSEAGRAVLRLLDRRTVRGGELDEVVVRIPPHAAIIVAKVARGTAAVWETLAAELETSAEQLSEQAV